jgi:hypothetical protein
MKRSLAVVALLIASSASAGLTYKFESSTTGIRSLTMTGTVNTEGQKSRMDVASGDQMIFKDNDVVLSTDGGKTMTVFDPTSKTYFDLQLDQLLGTSTGMLNSLGDMVKIAFANPQVNVRDEGDGGTIEGFPTRKYVLEASYDINIDAMGQKMTTHATMNTENWMTDQLSSELSSFMQARGLRTGIEAVDKMIEAQATMHGFPLKQITTMHITQGDNVMTMTTSSAVTGIQRHAIEASQFAAPTGYTKVDYPMTKMLRQLKQ